MNSEEPKPVFDYRALRLLMGLIAISIPIVVSILAVDQLPSISASYYSEARDVFVGMLCIVGSFWFAYNGHMRREKVASKFAAAFIIMVALFPTACLTCGKNTASFIHSGATALYFGILIYFCFSPFRKKTKGQPGTRGRRGKVYLTCGWIMVLCMVTLALSNFPSIIDKETVLELRIKYWVETIALIAFGIAWIVAGKVRVVGYFVNEKDALQLF